MLCLVKRRQLDLDRRIRIGNRHTAIAVCFMAILFCATLFGFSLHSQASSKSIATNIPPAYSWHRIPAGATDSYESYNWAGYSVATNFINPAPEVTAAYGSWIVQTVQASSSATYSSQWVGIGGFFSGDSTLIQTGTSSDSDNNANTYNAWYELLPATETVITSLTISPGDYISASVVCTSSCTSSTQTWTITLEDTTTGKTFTDTGVSYSSSLLSADWIEERPCVVDSCSSIPRDLGTLANFGTAYYGYDYTSLTNTNYATVASTTLPIGSLNYNYTSMYNNAGNAVIATPSALSSDGTSFIVYYGSTVPVPDLPLGNLGVLAGTLVAIASYGAIRVIGQRVHGRVRKVETGTHCLPY